MFKLNRSKTMKIKLVAIAKDEAAYLPEWIFHHLHFGFDAIDIYVNNTTDNTNELATLLSSFSNVRFLDGDDFFVKGGKGSQQKVYNAAFMAAKASGFSHIMFLDIDEFWTPVNMSSTIKDCLVALNADVISFEWLNKFENEKFAPAIAEKVSGEHHHLVKSIMSLDLKFEKLDIHNVTCKAAKSVLSDGSLPIFGKDNQKLLSVNEVKPYLIIHRMYRSSMEYVSLLGRGRPRGGRFKDNRNGFCHLRYKFINVMLDEQRTQRYHQSREAFLEQYIPLDYMQRAHQFVEDRYYAVLKLIKNASISDAAALKKILKHLDLPDVNAAYEFYLQNTLNSSEKGIADNQRESATLLEKKHLGRSNKLIQLASFVKLKVSSLLKRLKVIKSS